MDRMIRENPSPSWLELSDIGPDESAWSPVLNWFHCSLDSEMSDSLGFMDDFGDYVAVESC